MRLISCLKIKHLYCNNQVMNQLTAKQLKQPTAQSEHSAHALLGINLHIANPEQTVQSDKTEYKGWICWIWNTLRCNPESICSLFSRDLGWTSATLRKNQICFAQMWRMAQHSEHKMICFWKKGFSNRGIEPTTKLSEKDSTAKIKR